MPIKVTKGPTFYKGIELLPTGTKISMCDQIWTLTIEKYRYRLDWQNEGARAKTYISFTKTETLKRNVEP
jgi:hypothetical protein